MACSRANFTFTWHVYPRRRPVTARRDLSILSQSHCAMYQRFSGLHRVIATFSLFCSLRGLIHPAVGFSARIKACYVTPLQQVRTCLCARCELRSQLTVACVHTRSSEQLVDHSAQPVGQNVRRLVRTETSGPAEPRVVTMQRNGLIQYALGRWRNSSFLSISSKSCDTQEP